MARNIIRADFKFDCCECGMGSDHFQLLETKAICAGKDPQAKIMACLRLNWSWAGYINNLKKNGLNPKRVTKKCRQFIVRPFDPFQYSEDFLDIVESRSPIKFATDINACIQGDYPSTDCETHWRMWWGIFEPDAIAVDEIKPESGKLLAFVLLTRLGDFAVYKHINGHQERFQDGILNKLHLDIMKYLLNKEEQFYKGLQFLLYDTFFESKKGILRWKKKMLFRPMKIKLQKQLCATTYREM
jgi:hypothetical protein